MASTAADIIASAKAEAEAARQSAMSSLSGLTTDLTNAYNQQQSATNALYQNTLNQLQSGYQSDAKAAYGNYMTERQNLTNQLNRLGLQNSGYGVSQGLLAGSAYSKNLAGLQNALRTNQANTGVQQQQALADLYNTYARNKMSADQFKYEAGQKAYDTAYSNAYQAYQDEISNALQQQYYNYLMSQSSGGGGYGGGGGGYRTSSSDGNGDIPFEGGYEVSTAYYQGNKNADAKYGTFSNGYQPNNVNGKKLSKTGDTITFNTTTLGGQNKTVTQNVWKTSDGTKYYWDGRDNKYHKM